MTDSWVAPSEEAVAGAIGLLTDPFMRAHFFEQLENPEWLVPLRKLGFFNVPNEELEVDAGGGPVPWPEGGYLARVAADRPAEVTELLLRRETSTNPWARRAIVDAAASLPAAFAKQLAPAVERIVRSESGWLDLPKIVSIAEHLTNAGEMGASRRILAALFAPERDAEESARSGVARDLVVRIDQYFYVTLLPRAVPLLARFSDISGLKLVGGWLLSAGPRAAAGDEAPYDPSTTRRPSIAPHEQNFATDEPEDALIDATRDVALRLSSDGRFGAVIDFLDHGRRFLLRRIGLEVAAQVVARDPSPGTVAVAFSLLMDPRLLDITARPDYIRLARALLPVLGGESLAAWVDLVESQEWLAPEDALRRIAAWPDGDPDSVTAEDVDRVRDRLRLRLLQPLSDVLPAALAEELIRLHARYGVIEHPEFTSYHQSFTGPTSPTTAGDLAAMSPEELARYLETWQPAGDHFFGPSVEGLARQLQSVATEAPELVGALAPRLADLGRSYVRAAFDGWAAAIKCGYRPDDAVWSLVEQVVAASDERVDASIDFDAHDAVWRYAQRSALELIAAQVRVTGGASPELERLWSLLQPLTEHPNPDRHPTAPRESSMGPMTDSLNEIRPQALRVAIQVLAASHAGAVDLSPLNHAILAALDGHIGVEADGALSVAAVIGEGVGRIWNVDPSWVSDREATLFSVLADDPDARAWADVVISVALRSYQTGKAFFTIIRPALAMIFTPAYAELDHVDGWPDRHTPIEAAAHHVLRGYLFGVIELEDDLLVQLFGDAVPVAVKSEALGFLGWQFMHWKDGPDPFAPGIIGRARALIEWRLGLVGRGAELREFSKFFWWPRSGVFSPTWWLPILKLVVDNEVGEHSGMLGEPLVEASKVAPGPTLEIVDRLLMSALKPWRLYDISGSAPTVIAAALRSPDPMVVASARDLLDRLGRAGSLQLVDAVESEIRRHSTPSG